MTWARDTILNLVASGDFRPGGSCPCPPRYRLLAAAAAVLSGDRVLDLSPGVGSAALLTGHPEALYAPVHAEAAEARAGRPPFALQADYRPVVAATPGALGGALAPLLKGGLFQLAYLGPERGGAWAAGALPACYRLLGEWGWLLVEYCYGDAMQAEAVRQFLLAGTAEHDFLIARGYGLVLARPGR